MNKAARIIIISACALLIAGLGITLLVRWFGSPCVSFEGMEFPARVELGEVFTVSISMKPRKEIEKDCSLFIHFRPSGFDAPLVNADVSIPIQFKRWIPGKTVKLGPFRCSIPVGQRAGRYIVEAGLFYPGYCRFRGRRLIRVPYCNRGWRDWEVGTIEAVERAPRRYPAGAFERAGYAVGLAGSLEKVFPEKEEFRGPLAGRVRLTSARNEYESFQIVVIPGARAVTGVRILPGDLRRKGGGGSISMENIVVRRVGYVKTMRPYYNVVRIGMWPDPLIPAVGEGITVEAGRVQPFWITVYVPPGTVPGEYEGEIAVRPVGFPETGVKFSLRVWDFSLPAHSSLPTGFDLYEYLIRKYYPRRPTEKEQDWRKRIAELCRSYYLDMLAHRISPIHNVGNPEFIGVRDGEYILDFTEFAEKVEYYTRAGQTDFGIALEARIDPERNVWSKNWYGFTGPDAVRGVFKAYGKYLEKRGWLGRAYTYIIDESYRGVKGLTRLIHEGNPGIRNLLTQTPREGYPDVDIWCVRLNNFDEAIARRFREEGKEVWIYVAGPTRPFPTIILDGSSMDIRILPWICWRFNIDGLLYWCVNFWQRVNPWEDPMSWIDQNGNGYLFYPGGDGPVDSIRLEVLRDGMEDYEYLRMFVECCRDEEILKLIGRTVPSTWNYTDSPEELLALRNAIGERLNDKR